MAAPDLIDHSHASETRQMVDRARSPSSFDTPMTNRMFGIAIAVIVAAIVALYLLLRY